jgi:heme/copper-type cytochrome/quinol oxidase subunit 3
MSNAVGENVTVDEEQYYHDANLGAIWSASRTLIAVVSTLFGGLVFSYFYLRSLNSHGLWDPNGIKASPLLGTIIMVFVIASAVIIQVVNRRLRMGITIDWQVGALVALLLGVLAGAFQIWILTRLNFMPGSSGYAGIYVASGPVYAAVVLLSMYWLETLIARSIRSRKAAAQDGGIGVSNQPRAENFRASLDGFTVFWTYFAVLSIVVWYLLYVL